MKIKSVSCTYVHKKMGDLQLGDKIVGPAGEKYSIREITDHGEQDVYKITLSDGRSFESMLSHLSTVHFRNSHVRPDKKVYDTVTTGYIMDHLDKYLFEIPTDETFTWSDLDAPQFLEMLPLHEYEPVDDEYLIPDLTKDPNKVYITSIEKTRREVCKCIAVDYPWGLYLIEDGILTHNSLLTNLCMSFEMVLFGLMREPYRILGHSQPVYESVKLPDGSYTTIADLRKGLEIANPVGGTEKIVNIVEQGTKATYKITFSDDSCVQCSLDHLWTVYDKSLKQYKVLPTHLILQQPEMYLFPDLQDCKNDADKIRAAEESFRSTNYFSAWEMLIVDWTVRAMNSVIFDEDTSGVYNIDTFYQKYKNQIDMTYGTQEAVNKKRKHSWYYEDLALDSLNELVFYLYNQKTGKKLYRNSAKDLKSNRYIEYMCNGKLHKAYPDFYDETGNLYEVKGSHLISDDDTFVNPFTSAPEILQKFKAKGEALSKANVVIVKDEQIQEMLNILEKDYGICGNDLFKYKKDMSFRVYKNYLWHIYKQNHKLDRNPRLAKGAIKNQKYWREKDQITFSEIDSILQKNPAGILGSVKVQGTCEVCGAVYVKNWLAVLKSGKQNICKHCSLIRAAAEMPDCKKLEKSRKLSESQKAFFRDTVKVAKRKQKEYATILQKYGSLENYEKHKLEVRKQTNLEKYGIKKSTAAMQIAYANLSPEEKLKRSQEKSIRQRGRQAWSKGKKHFNNGKVEIIASECPEGFVPGRLKR